MLITLFHSLLQGRERMSEQLILPYVLKCPECGRWIDRYHFVIVWWGQWYYFDFIRCKLIWRRKRIAQLNMEEVL